MTHKKKWMIYKEPEWTVEDRSDLLEYTNYGDNDRTNEEHWGSVPCSFLPGGSPDQPDHDDANGRKKSVPRSER